MKDRIPPGWKLTELLPGDHRAEKHVQYVRRIAKELEAIPRQKREVPTHFNGKLIADLSHSEREEFILSMQPKSTQDALVAQKTRNSEDDMDHVLRPFPKEEDWKREIEVRDLSPEEILVYKDMQRTSKNTLGQSVKGSVDELKRELGIHAFTYSKPANPTAEDMKRLKDLTALKAVVAEESPKPVKPKKKWWRFWEDDTRAMTPEEIRDYLAGND